ncbi:MAG: DUF58 domain-containing protein [bacterium]|nr:DUF58 domain-containing protein [bacterium]
MAQVTVSLDELILLRAKARGFSFLPRQPVTSLLAGRHASRLRGRGLTFEELRHYRPGDDVRLIDWKATARKRATQIRVYNEERERPVLLIVDQRGPMFFGSRRAMKSVVAAEVAALSAWRTLEVGDRIGGLVFNESEIVEIRPHRSQTRVLRLLHEVTRLNHLLAVPGGNQDDRAASQERVHLNDALSQALPIAKHDHLVVLVSDLDGADQETQRLSTLLSAHNDMLVVATYDPLGASLIGQPGMVAADRGEEWRIPTDSKFAEAFRASFQNRLDEWRNIFRALRVPVLPVSTARPVHEQVRELFGKR